MAPKPKAKRPRANEIDKRVGKIIKTLRMAMGMSQTDLGRVLGVTFQQIQKYENGFNRVAAGRLIQIAEALQTDISILTNTPTREGGGTVVHELLAVAQSPYALRLLRAFDGLNDEQQYAVFKLVSAMENMVAETANASR